MTNQANRETWGTRIGVILAVTGSAVGLGNFLRFPGQAAQYGGGAFLIPYLVAFLVIGLPLAWLEWGLGRYGGARGHNSAPGIFRVLTGSRYGSYLGMLGTVMPVMIYMYYVFVEAWCLAYAWDYLTGAFAQYGGDSAAITQHFLTSAGAAGDGAVFSRGAGRMFVFLALCFGINFFLIYRGIHRGIEKFCNVALPLLFLCAVIILVRVLTLPANPLHPEQTVINGLGYMWNPVKEGTTLLATLSNAEVWLAATGQIFFSLSLGFGLILTYSSYLKPDDDVALSSLTSVAGNGFAEVVLGGMIAIPAAFVFLGPSVVQNPPGTFGMGFITLPNVFNQMPAGSFFGFLFFFLLFLAAVTSSLSMLQPAIALLEEGLGLTRKPSVALLGFITLTGCLFIVYFSKDFAALDTVDFWMANFFIFIFATAQTIVFGWVLGIDQGFAELQRGAEITLPTCLKFVIKYISPTFLLVIFLIWCFQQLPGRLEAIFTLPEEGPPVVLMSIGLILLVLTFFAFVVSRANLAWDKEDAS
ncbi:MAG: sodium-dependent transporter [Kiritimatiellae bacterium]|nr:sodium-dependent transporter [Kiritimatiellia bacterium]